jgi:hypothetical protein
MPIGKYALRSQNIPYDQNILQHFPCQSHPKFTHSGIFGPKRNRLAALVVKHFLICLKK